MPNDIGASSGDLMNKGSAGGFIAIGAESLLKAVASLTDIVLEETDDMEHIDAYYDVREALPGEGDKSAVHITVEEADAAALFWRVVPEIGGQVFKIHTWKDVDNVANGTIGVIAVERLAFQRTEFLS